MENRATEELIELGDIDELVRHARRLADSEEWEDLLELRDLSRRALERGRQLWPVAAHAEYRLALQAPGRWAARMLVPGTGRFTLGPLAEVAASTHAWDDLAPHAPPTPDASIAAHERVVRGEDLTGDSRVDPGVLEVPLVLQPWEPQYPVAEYKPDEAQFPLPVIDRFEPVKSSPGEIVEDPEAVRALVDLVSRWTTESNGRAEAIAVRGTAAAAVAALGPREIRMTSITPADAMARMAWSAASGGGHGSRRGMAPGRFAAWWTLAALAGLLDDWPVHPDELGEAAGDLRWFAWDTGGAQPGWTCRLAVEDPAEGLAWALSATDERLV